MENLPGAGESSTRGSLDLIREEPKLRFGCLELYVRLTDDVEGLGDDRRDRFVVEEDVRQRVRVHWRSADASGDATSWRVSCAFSPWESQVAICETLGREAVDWLWDGLNALIFSISDLRLQAHSASTLFAAEWPNAGRGGLFGFCLQELCRRVALDRERFQLGLSLWECRGNSKPKDLLASCEEETEDALRFEMVAFDTLDEAMALWEACVQQPGASSGLGRPAVAHLFVRIMLFDAHKQSMAALHFAQVANSLDPEIQADHKALQQFLSANPGPATSSGLLEVLSPLIRGNCKSFLLCTVPERPGKGDEAARQLLDLAEQASLITANCQRLQGKRREDFQWAKLEDVLGRLRWRSISSPAEPRSAAAAAAAAVAAASPPRRSPADDAAGQSLKRPTPALRVPTRLPSPPLVEAEGTGANDRKPASQHSQPTEVAEPLVVAPSFQAPEETITGDVRIQDKAAATLMLQEYNELARAVGALRAKNRAKAARRQRNLVEVRAELTTLSEGIQQVEDAVNAPILLQAFRQELVSLKDEVQVLRRANALLSGLHGEEKRRAAQRVAAKQLQQEATKLDSTRALLEKGEKRAGLVQRCLEEVHARLDSAKIAKLQAEEEIQQLNPAFMELGRHLEISETDLRWLQGELDKLRQASGGIRAEIVHLREVKDAVNELPPEDSKASRMSVGRGSLERFATLQRRLATVAPQLMPLCTRARSSMEELLECCERLEERQKRLEQVAPSEGAPQGLSRVSKASGAMEQRHKVLPRSRSVETVGARSARSVATTAARGASPRQDPSVPGSAAGRDYEVKGSPVGRQGIASAPTSNPDFRSCCASCGAMFMPDAQFCQHCGSKRYPDPLPVKVKKPSIKSTAGTLQDLGLVESEMKGRSVESTPRGASVSLKTSSSGYSRPKLRPTASK